MTRLGKRRTWSNTLGGYTYDGINLAKCQCNLSAGVCKCGLHKAEKAARLKWLAEQELNGDG